MPSLIENWVFPWEWNYTWCFSSIVFEGTYPLIYNGESLGDKQKESFQKLEQFPEKVRFFFFLKKGLMISYFGISLVILKKDLLAACAKLIHFKCYLDLNGLVLFLIHPSVVRARKNMNVFVIFLWVEKIASFLTDVNPYMAIWIWYRLRPIQTRMAKWKCQSTIYLLRFSAKLFTFS